MKTSVLYLYLAFATMLFLIVIPASGQRSGLKAGIAKVDITPSESLYMGGYDESGRPGPSRGHDGNIYVRALVLDDDTNRLVFVELDVVSMPPADYDKIRKMVSDKTGIDFNYIILGCVHNHSAPYPGGKNTGSDWYKNFDGMIVRSVREAIEDLEPVRIGGGTGRSYIAMNRRKKMTDTLSYLTFDENNSSQSYGKYKTDHPVLIREMDGVTRLGANPQGSIDDEIGIIRIDKLNGEPKAAFINYACHGTTLGARNEMINPEWNGWMLEYLEKQYPGLTGIFVQGAAGDINPRFVGGLDGYKDNPENTQKLGYEIGHEVERTFNSIVTSDLTGTKIRLVHENIICPEKYDNVVKDFHHTTVAVPVTAIRLGEFSWVTFPGELFHEIGQKIKAAEHSRISFFAGYCNGSYGYLPTQQAYSEGGYEPWSSQFAPVTEKILIKGVDELLMRLY